jgi:hypothetical protein
MQRVGDDADVGKRKGQKRVHDEALGRMEWTRKHANKESFRLAALPLA